MVSSEDLFEFIQEASKATTRGTPDGNVDVYPPLSGENLASATASLVKLIEIEGNVLLGQRHMDIHEADAAAPMASHGNYN